MFLFTEDVHIVMLNCTVHMGVLKKEQDRTCNVLEERVIEKRGSELPARTAFDTESKCIVHLSPAGEGEMCLGEGAGGTYQLATVGRQQQ